MNFYKKLSLQKKLILAFFSISFFIVLIGGASLFFGTKTISEYRKIALKNLPASVAAINLKVFSKDVRLSLLKLGTVNLSDDELVATNSKLQDLVAQYNDVSKEYQAIPFVLGEKDLFDKTEERWKALALSVQKAQESRLKKTPEGIDEYNLILKGEFKENNNNYTEAINDLVVFHQELATKSRQLAERAEAYGHQTSLLLILIGFLVALAISFIFGKGLSSTLFRLISKMQIMVSNVESTAERVSYLSSDLSSQTQQQASAIQETSTAVVEISTTMAKSMEGAELSKKMSEEAQGNVKTGQVVIQGLVDELEKLKTGNISLVENVDDTLAKMDKLVMIIREIETKTKVINEIVFQTKLLSFNASVEAARAGEYGKGFAVVAEEIGKLAQMSGQASSEIENMLKSSIEHVDKLTHESKDSLKGSISHTNTSLSALYQRLDESKKVFELIGVSTSDVGNEMNQICFAFSEQNFGMQEISKAITQLENTTQANTSTSDQASDSSTELKHELKLLKRSIGDLFVMVQGSAANDVAKSEES